MQGSLGEKLGEGVFADVHAWAPGQVVKLFKAEAPRWLRGHEARMTRAVRAAGAPAPEVLDEVTVDGRFGIVLPRFDGPTLLQHYRTGAVTFEQAGAILASVAMSVHATLPPVDVLSLRDNVHGTFRYSGDRIPEHIVTGVLALLERLPPGEGLCHADIHPENVIMTAAGPKLIDWPAAVRAPATYDLACSHVGLFEIAPQIVDNPARPRAVNAAMQSEYARLAGMPVAALTAAIEPWLPIARVRLLLGRAVPVLREWLIQRIEADLQGDR